MRNLMIGCAMAGNLAGGAMAQTAPASTPLPAPAAPAHVSPYPPLDTAETARRAKAESIISDTLVDPDSAKFKWLDGASVMLTKYRNGMFGKTLTGNLIMECGRVNSRNRMGGMVGYHWFVVVFRDDAVVSSDMDADNEYNITPNADVCRNMGL